MPLTPAITRRAALTTLSAAAVGYAFLGPRPQRQRSDGRIVLDYWEKWTGHEGEAMLRVVNDFNKSQDRLWVRYFAMGGIDQKAMIAIAGGNPPDIIGMGNFSIPAYAECNALLPLDELASEAGIRKDDYARAVWPMLTHRGKLWGIVNTCGSLALFYNKTLFQQAGIDPERPPRTIDELDEYSARLTRENGRDLAQVGFLHMEPDWWTWHWGYYFGGSLYDETADRALADSEQTIRAYRWAQSYPERLGVDRMLRFQSGFGYYGTPENPFLAGKVAMTNQGPWLANMIRQYRPDMDYAVAPFPVDSAIEDPDAPIGLLDSDVLVIPRGARHPRESMEFIAYTQRPEIVEYLSAVHCKNSPLARSSDRFVKNHPNRYVSVHAAIADSPRAFLFPRTRTWEHYVAEFNAAMARMWTLREKADIALASVQRAAQAELDEAADRRRRREAAGGLA
ncbi:MAG: ABC transporter substrate-binding protein [Phycisphaerae bacterium]|nr:ABC transporter substrate-binding protein [Phycisphaerae bacterium]